MNGGITSDTLTLNTYQQVRRRIERMVSDPRAQKIQTIQIAKRDEEPHESWERVIQELEETDGITVERFEDDSVRIAWQKYIDL